VLDHLGGESNQPAELATVDAHKLIFQISTLFIRPIIVIWHNASVILFVNPALNGNSQRKAPAGAATESSVVMRDDRSFNLAGVEVRESKISAPNSAQRRNAGPLRCPIRTGVSWRRY
jgi:hypothetical protein